MKLLIGTLGVCLVLLSSMRVGHAQHLTSAPHIGVEQVPIDDEVYALLRHLYVRGVIEDYSEAQLPLSEYDIMTFLTSADTTALSSVERELRTKYIRTFAHEPREAVTMFPARDATPLFFSGIFTDQDKYLYRWFDDSTHSDLFVHGVASLELRHRSNPSANVLLGVIGGRFSGTLGGHVGYFMQTTNGQKFGDSAFALEDPALAKNRNLTYYSQAFFDVTSAELAYNYDWFTGKIARESIGIGGSYQNDNVILSPQVPYYDFVSLAGHVGAVRYQAIVGSLLADTMTGGPGSSIPDKFITAHDLTFELGKSVELGFTDVVVYSGRFDLAYLNPFSFLKSVEHSLNDRDNGLLGVHARWRITPGIEVRGQGMLDDVKASLIGTNYWSNKFAWQFGGMWAGVAGLRDVDLLAEWTRVEPFTYSHFNPNNAYSTTQTLLGSQIGPNAMSYWSQVRWQADPKVLLALDGQLVLRGENVYDSTGKLVYNAGADYTRTVDASNRNPITTILNGRRVNIFSVTVSIEYEPWRGLLLFARGTNKSVNYLEEAPVTPGVQLDGLGLSLKPHEHPETLFAIGARALF